MTIMNAARSNLRRAAVRSVRYQSTAGKGLIPSNVLNTWYNIFGKSNAGYASWIVIGILAGEAFTGGMTNMVWNSVNHGKTYATVDWSKFVVEDDDDDEEDEDEEDDDDDDDE
eukprot:CAMPEP_0119005644 /NCGR_PEP_ID=MMETSP1176-20130426/1842_1 /TAXON_ID=265551 /ORGANISM="Synedropsis recta cf, Strain CCMP1620" /LENGTH=112 /DNA_ID=CAMNT_0006957479 /DNA_START=41 /DNA_END=379 /DNA_ORIENTATION=-